MPVSDILARVRSTGIITTEDALEARRAVYGNDGTIDSGEIEGLFAVDEAAKTFVPAWSTLLVEAGTDYIVHQQVPHGYIDAANAQWLVARIGSDGIVKTATELELLIKVLEAAKSSPPELAGFALRQVESAVIDGVGPLAGGGELMPGRIGRGETDVIRRILYAFGGDGGIAISRSEAEVLLNINDRTVEADNDPAWSDLFVKAMANCIMAASGYSVPTRAVALARDKRLESPVGGLGDFFSRMFSGGLHGILEAYLAPTDGAAAARSVWQGRSIALAEIVDEEEASWLAHRIGRDGVLHENEKALLRFIRSESPEIHPALTPLIDKAA